MQCLELELSDHMKQVKQDNNRDGNSDQPQKYAAHAVRSSIDTMTGIERVVPAIVPAKWGTARTGRR